MSFSRTPERTRAPPLGKDAPMSTRSLGNTRYGILAPLRAETSSKAEAIRGTWVHFSYRDKKELGEPPLLPADGEARVQWDYRKQ